MLVIIDVAAAEIVMTKHLITTPLSFFFSFFVTTDLHRV